MFHAVSRSISFALTESRIITGGVDADADVGGTSEVGRGEVAGYERSAHSAADHDRDRLSLAEVLPRVIALRGDPGSIPRRIDAFCRAWE